MAHISVDNIMSKRTMLLLRKKGIHIVVNKTEAKTTKKKVKKNLKTVLVENNILEHYVFVMEFVKHKYGINQNILQHLFYLYPKKIFQKQDYYDLPFKLNINFKRFIDGGYIEPYMKISNKQLYQLTTNSKNAVERFHHYLVDITNMPVATMLINKDNEPSKIEPVKLSKLIEKLKAVK